MRFTVVLTVLILAMLLGNIGTKTAHGVNKKVLVKNLKQSKNTVRWFQMRKHRWRLHPRFENCQNVARLFSADRGDICYESRTAYRAHKRRIVRLMAILYPRPANYNAWNCIHHHEAGPEHGGWAANTGNGYYGGLQMDLTFQRTYGPELLRTKGTADNWTPYEQMMVAEKARASGRGFYPWPRTARMCGLI